MPFQHLGGEHVNAYNLLYSDEYAKREESFMGRSKSRNLLATSCCEGVRILRQTMSVLCRHLQHRHRVILTCDTTRDRKGDREKTKDEPSLLFDGQTKYVWSTTMDEMDRLSVCSTAGSFSTNCVPIQQSVRCPYRHARSSLLLSVLFVEDAERGSPFACTVPSHVSSE